MKVRIVVQARTNSARLFGKSLRPLGGIPLAVLTCLRAANRGVEVVLATSDDTTDDLLAQRAQDYKVPCVRGPLDNVLERFYLAAQGLESDDVLIRLTADNSFPDGELIEECLAYYFAHSLEYAATDMDRLPYGLSLEIFRMRHLQMTMEGERTPDDVEHVTSTIRKKYQGPKVFLNNWAQFASPFRCTIDLEVDYRRIIRVFDQVEPVRTSWKELVRRLNRIGELPDEPKRNLILGGAQIGMQYGITNRNDYSPERAEGLFRSAYLMGFDGVDSARAYGNSEQVIGSTLKKLIRREDFRVITKLPPQLEPGNLRTQTQESLSLLGLPSLEGLLFHRSSHLAHLDTLQALKNEGLIRKTGVSIQNPEELDLIEKCPGIDIVQLPCSVLDHRWKGEAVNARLTKLSQRTEFHVRSIFLQGILADLKKPGIWPIIGEIYDQAKIKEKIENLVRDLQFRNSFELAIAYGRSLPWANSLVIGAGSEPELNAIIEAFYHRCLSPEERRECEKHFKDIPLNLLNPACWRSNP